MINRIPAEEKDIIKVITKKNNIILTSVTNVDREIVEKHHLEVLDYLESMK